MKKILLYISCPPPLGRGNGRREFFSYYSASLEDRHSRKTVCGSLSHWNQNSGESKFSELILMQLSCSVEGGGYFIIHTPSARQQPHCSAREVALPASVQGMLLCRLLARAHLHRSVPACPLALWGAESNGLFLIATVLIQLMFGDYTISRVNWCGTLDSLIADRTRSTGQPWTHVTNLFHGKHSLHLIASCSTTPRAQWCQNQVLLQPWGTF